MLQPNKYSFNLKKINEAVKGLRGAVRENKDKKDIRRWSRLLKANAELFTDLLTEELENETKLEQIEITFPAGSIRGTGKGTNSTRAAKTKGTEEY